MKVSESTKQYLADIAERAIDYFEALEFAKDFVLDNRVVDNRGIVDCMLMSILWCASNRSDNLTEEDVCMYLNVDATVKQGDVSVKLMPEMKDWTLEEVLTFVNDSHGEL